MQVQRTEPISLDPLLYPLLAHAGMKAFGAGAFALRLPALMGFLLMQVCLFFFVRRLAGERAGVVAAAFPALTATLYLLGRGTAVWVDAGVVCAGAVVLAGGEYQ